MGSWTDPGLSRQPAQADLDLCQKEGDQESIQNQELTPLLHLIPEDVKKHISFTGMGGQIAIGSGLGLATAENYGVGGGNPWGGDPIPLFNLNPLRILDGGGTTQYESIQPPHSSLFPHSVNEFYRPFILELQPNR